MAKLIKRHSGRAKLPPDTGAIQAAVEPVRVTLIDYTEQQFQERQISDIEECFKLRTEPTVTWINIDGIHDFDLILKLGKGYGLHDLVIEDIVTAWQRPKFEDYDDYIFVVFRMLTYDQKLKIVQSENVSLVLGPKFVLSFQENVGDVFEQIRNRIRSNKGRIRKMGCDYLAYSLIDAAVDHYFSVLEHVGERVESLEDELIDQPDQDVLTEIHSLKNQMLSLRKSVWPMREVINNLEKTESPLITNGTSLYLRDVYDHTIQIVDTIESYRDTVSGILDIYLSSLNTRLNSVMKVLTIIATIFMPLTFLSGIYGMNFKYMPEIEWPLAYPWSYPVGFWVLILLAIGGMLLFFRHKKWL